MNQQNSLLFPNFYYDIDVKSRYLNNIIYPWKLHHCRCRFHDSYLRKVKNHETLRVREVFKLPCIVVYLNKNRSLIFL